MSKAETNTIYISPQDDFGLALNAATRMYRRNVSERTLNMLDEYFTNALTYIDLRTLWCALQDLLPDYLDPFVPKIPQDQQEKFIHLRNTIAEEYYLREKGQLTNYVLCSDAAYGGIITSNGREGIFPTTESFLAWLNDLWQTKEAAGYTDASRVPLTGKCADEFGYLVQLMCEYSVGRMTYMPSTAAAFALGNKEYIGAAEKEQILKVIKDRGESVWIELKKRLEKD